MAWKVEVSPRQKGALFWPYDLSDIDRKSFRNALGHKIVRNPIRINSARNERNMYLNNLCFVCDSWSKTSRYKPVAKKLGKNPELQQVDLDEEEPPEAHVDADWDLTIRQVTLMPLLKFSNMYRATASLSRLFGDPELQKSCMTYISQGATDSKEKIPTSAEVMEILCKLQQGTSLREVCENYSANNNGYDVCQLVMFAQMHGLAKSLKRYPVYLRNTTLPKGKGAEDRVKGAQGVRRLFTGRHCNAEICCIARIDLPTLEQIAEEEPNVAAISISRPDPPTGLGCV